MKVEDLLKPFPIKEFHPFPRAMMGPGAHEMVGPEALKMGVAIVTALSQLRGNRGSGRGTPCDCCRSSVPVQSHCETTKFSLCPTGGQVVAGSNPVSPTRGVGFDLQ
jgi:hypothetical protein